jgi:hypothetical protein
LGPKGFLQRLIHKQKSSVLSIADDFSLYIRRVALWTEQCFEAVVECFEQAVIGHGEPEAVMSGGGVAFGAWRGVSRFSSSIRGNGRRSPHREGVPTQRFPMASVNPSWDRGRLARMVSIVIRSAASPVFLRATSPAWSGLDSM